MAKRRKSSNLPGIIAGLVFIFSVVAIVMFFVANIAIKDSETTYTGLQIAFGYSEGGSVGIFNASVQIFDFSFLNLLPYVLVICGLVLSLIGGLGKRNGLCLFICVLLFIGASVLFFLSPSFVNFITTGTLENSDLFELAIGGIIAGICAGLCAVFSLFRLAVK